MAVFLGRNSMGVPTFALGTNNSTLHNYPPDSSLVFRSDLPYILGSEYSVTTYSDTASSIGTVRYFTLPTAVRSAMASLRVVLFFWVNGTTTIACTPQYAFESWYGSTWGKTYLSKSYINKNYALFNPSFISGSGSNKASSSTDNGATPATFTAAYPYLFSSTETKIGFPLFTNRTFTPLQLRCVVLDNLSYTSATDPRLIHSKLDVGSSGVKISKTQFLVNGIDFRTKSLLVYSASSSKPTNTTAISDVSGNITNKYPGISTFTGNKLYSVARTEYRAGDNKAFNITPSQYNILSGIRDQTSSIIGANGYTTHRTTTDPVVSDLKTPVFGIMEPSSTTASVEIESSTSSIKFGGAVFMSPSVKPLYLISSGKSFSYAGSIYSKTFTSNDDLLTEVQIGTLAGVFNSSTSVGCGVLTVYSSTQPDYDHNTYVTFTSGDSFFDVKSSSITTTNHTCMHSALVQLSANEKITLFTTALNTVDLAPYVIGAGGGVSAHIFLKRVDGDLQIFARFDDGGLSFSVGSTFYFNTKVFIPAFSFSFTELQ